MPLGAYGKEEFTMSPLMIVLTVIYVIFCLFLIGVVLLQSGKSAGGMDTFLAKNKAKTWDARLAKITKWVAVLFMALTLVLFLFL